MEPPGANEGKTMNIWTTASARLARHLGEGVTCLDVDVDGRAQMLSCGNKANGLLQARPREGEGPRDETDGAPDAGEEGSSDVEEEDR